MLWHLLLRLIAPTDHDALHCPNADIWVLLRDHCGRIHSKVYLLNSSWRGPGLARPKGNVELEVKGSLLTVRARVRIAELSWSIRGGCRMNMRYSFVFWLLPNRWAIRANGTKVENECSRVIHSESQPSSN